MSKSHIISVRVTDEQLATLESAAANQKLGLSEYIRDRLLTPQPSQSLIAWTIGTPYMTVSYSPTFSRNSLAFWDGQQP